MKGEERQEIVRQFRQRLLETMEARGINRSQLSKKIGIDRSTLSQLLTEGGDRLPRGDTVRALASSLQVSADWLLGLTSESRSGAAILRQSMEFRMSSRSPVDESIAKWREEATGYKIRYVPSTIPDLVKTEAVLKHEFRDYTGKSPAQAISDTQTKLAYSRMPDTDMEICLPRQRLELLASGAWIWSGLSREARIEQLDAMIEIFEELYPRLRLYLFDELNNYSAPYTVFGVHRAAIYLGQMYFAFTTTEHVRTLIDHFDSLIRSATVQADEVSSFLRSCREMVSHSEN